MHPIYRIISFKTIDAFTLLISFDDGVRQSVDFRPILKGELYGPLRDLSLFNQVSIDPEVHTLVWPNGADFDPDTLHDWPIYAQAWEERARQWELCITMSAERGNDETSYYH
ncbi:MAG: DUF2442 domain-containing protein [Proteobacteria bacterium]|nr:DUF2442 domain-containing protein [Pseudomonadota bacterium]